MNRSIQVVEFDEKSVEKGVSFSPEEIDSCQAFKPGHTRIDVIGGGATENMQAMARNAKRKSEVRKNTGLYFSLDRLDDPTVFANMEFEAAEKWDVLLRRLIDGELERQEEPTPFPVVEN